MTTQPRPMSDYHAGLVNRPMSANVESLQKPGVQRPSSEVLAAHYKSPEAEAIDRWFEDLSYYERTLEQMARAKLDDNFREELKHIEQWFNVLSDPERTTALYSLLQHTTQVQIRFFITVLQQMAQKDPSAASPQVQPKAPSAVGAPPAMKALQPPGVSPSVPRIPESEEDEKYLGVAKANRRLYDRNSTDEKYAQMMGDLRIDPYRTASEDLIARGTRSLLDEPEYVVDTYSSYKRSSRGSVNMSPIIRPKTPGDDAIDSADWSLNPMPNHSKLGNGTMSPSFLPQAADFDIPTLSLQTARSPYSRPMSPARPVSPIVISPPSPSTRAPLSRAHPSPGWGHIDLRSPGGYATSDFSEHDGFSADHGENGADGGRRGGSQAGGHKEKGKIPESVDLEALNDIPGWLRSLRLHKYTPTFENMKWQDMIKLDDEGLQAKGVSALGARRKMLKVFEMVRKDLEAKVLLVRDVTDENGEEKVFMIHAETVDH
ncbi:hypothetical protein HK104_007585 [Borealophlyctis nickersoniae]|nr:hypothetical protein HK104_007585 [Borealophlyctis nickersoniae]